MAAHQSALVVGGAVYLVLFTWCLIIALEARRGGRRGWWVYVICALLFPLDVLAVVGWHARWRRSPLVRAGEPFM